jgi:hypothetical protein
VEAKKRKTSKKTKLSKILQHPVLELHSQSLVVLPNRPE